MSERGISTVVSYVLTLGIVALLLTSLFGVFAPIVSSQQDEAVRANLQVFGNDLAGDLESADRLAASAGNNAIVELRTRLPERVAGEPYEIEIEPASDGDGYAIRLLSPDIEAPVRVTVKTDASIDTAADPLEGGTLVMTYDSDNNQLVVKND